MGLTQHTLVNDFHDNHFAALINSWRRLIIFITWYYLFNYFSCNYYSYYFVYFTLGYSRPMNISQTTAYSFVLPG